MLTLSITDLRVHIADIANKVIFGKERICIKKSGKPAFALVPIEDAEALEALEEKIDLEEAIKAIKEGGFVSFEELKKELNL